MQVRLHRDGEDLATGLDLPRLSCDFDYFLVAFTRPWALALCWHFNAGGHFGERVDGLKPSRAHLLWACESTEHLRAGLRPPRDRCEECLLLQGVPEQPPAPVAVDPAEFFDDLVQALQVQMQEAAAIYLETDGSELMEIGSFVPDPPQQKAKDPNKFFDSASFLLRPLIPKQTPKRPPKTLQLMCMLRTRPVLTWRPYRTWMLTEASPT